MENLTLSRKGIVLVCVPLVFECIFLLVLALLLQQTDSDLEKEVRARSIILKVESISKLFLQADVALSGYVATRTPLLSDRYDRVTRQIPDELREIQLLDSQSQKHTSGDIRAVAQTVEHGLHLLNEAKQAIDTGSNSDAELRLGQLHKMIKPVSDSIERQLYLPWNGRLIARFR